MSPPPRPPKKWMNREQGENRGENSTSAHRFERNDASEGAACGGKVDQTYTAAQRGQGREVGRQSLG